ncbi:unnamed protein product [Paramecium primaurelia]|uniref:WD domain, G-beta repeat protein n=1 Tax=Paramecium primaurelia TaxID=5886 RepID=A0A8S1QNP7_PARPR|nr:unnamed protein product [Paramecium primaurelia]
MLKLQCASGHEYLVDMFCTNPFCKEKRLYCFEQCQKLQYRHSGHSQNTEKIQELCNYVKGISQQCYELVNDLEVQFLKVEQIFKQFKDDILSKYSLSQGVLKQLNSNQINEALCNFVRFNEEKQKLSTQFKEISNQFILSLENCSEEFEISQQDYFKNSEDSFNLNSKHFSYVLMQENRINQSTRCCSFTFNNDSSIIIVGLENGDIQIYELINELMKQKQICKIHSDAVYCLQFMKKSNQFVSGSGDTSIIIWSLNDQLQWFNSYKLLGHTGIMLCLIIDSSENVIFSGNSDSLIKIWDKQNNNYLCKQTLNENKGDILSISLNPEQNILISCVEEQNYLIVYQNKHNLWNIYQKIEIQLWGYRLCFIDNKSFTFQSNLSKFMEIYEINQETKLFTQINQVPVKTSSQCDALFPQQYIQQKSILINKNGQFINLFRIIPNISIQSQESIKFGSEYIYGALDKNAEYLITWDDYSQQIQLRKYKEEQILI